MSGSDGEGLETGSRSTLNGHERGNPGDSQGHSLGLPRQSFTRQHPPLVAKQLLGLTRAFVFTPDSVWRFPELALLAGNILTYLAATLPAIPSGFWDLAPKKTPGRLRRALAKADFPKLEGFSPQLRKKQSVTSHLPKGIKANRRQKHQLRL